MRNLFLFCLLAFFHTVVFAQQKVQKPYIISYYSGPMERLDSFDVRQTTHLIYCFGHLKGNAFHLSGAKDTAMIQKMVSLKQKNPALKVLLSLGGWGGCAPCSEVFGTAKGRTDFVRSVKEVTQFLGTDGIDLDWEYPVVEGYPGHKYAPSDKEAFTALVQELRKELGPTATVSFAAGGFQKFLDDAIDWSAVMKEVDFVNMMTYDLVSGYAVRTGHHTALFSTPQQKESADNAIQYLIKKGIRPEQIILGAAFYARVWEGVPDVDNGLYQSGKFKMGIPYRNFHRDLSPAAGYTLYWDETAQAPYAYNKDKGLYATFDDKRSVKAKTEYVLQHKLGGIMYWELGSDAFTDGLMQTIYNTVYQKP